MLINSGDFYMTEFNSILAYGWFRHFLLVLLHLWLDLFNSRLSRFTTGHCVIFCIVDSAKSNPVGEYTFHRNQPPLLKVIQAINRESFSKSFKNASPIHQQFFHPELKFTLLKLYTFRRIYI